MKLSMDASGIQQRSLKITNINICCNFFFLHLTEQCRELKYEEKITYKGCSTNVTLSKCEGSCPSSTK